MLLSNSKAEDSQQVSILAAAGPSTEDLGDDPTNDEFLGAVTYESVSSVIRQCDRHSSAQHLNGNHVCTSRSHNSRFQTRNPMSKERYSTVTMRSTCRLCGKYGHWKNAHLSDGSLPPGVKSFDIPINNQNQNQKYQPDKNQHKYQSSSKPTNYPKTVSFNTNDVIKEDYRSSSSNCTCTNINGSCSFCED